MPRINLSKIGSASAAAATGAILAIAPVFAQTSPTTPAPTGGSVITIIITAANAASVTHTFDISPETAAELAARLAEHQAELGAHQAELAAETTVDEDVDEDVDEEVEDAPATTTKTAKTFTVTVNGQTKTLTAHTESEND